MKQKARGTENDVKEAEKEEIKMTGLEKEDAIDKEKWHNTVYKVVRDMRSLLSTLFHVDKIEFNILGLPSHSSIHFREPDSVIWFCV